ncbi:MAG: HAD-IIA family hydrolase [Actinomycetota bacterium]
MSTLLGRYRAVLLDLDGVLFRGDEPVPGAVEALAELGSRDVPMVFITNNSARTPEQVAEKLRRLGFDVEAERVVTSASALGGLLGATERDPAAATAFVIGEDGIREALRDAGVEVLEGEPEAADAVVVGWDRAADYDRLKRASLLVQRGARLIATNTDVSYPAADGDWPGAGALLAVVTLSSRARAEVAGKPGPALFRGAARVSGVEGPYLVVGDRLETDVAGASALGWDAALVLTGVARPSDVVRGPWLPAYLGRTVGDVVTNPARIEPAGPGDLGAVRGLLDEAGLYAGDIEARVDDLLVARTDAGVVGAGALEVSGQDGLLRSLAVAPERRGAAVGTHLVAALAARARDAGGTRLWLLTETAERFFTSLGFQRVGRGALPAELEASPSAGANCAETAVAMRLAS